MVETLKLKEKNKIKKLEKIAETRMAVERERERERESLYLTWNSFTKLHTQYCHLENKKRKLNSSKGRTMPVKQAIALPLCALTEKVEHNHRRGGP